MNRPGFDDCSSFAHAFGAVGLAASVVGTATECADGGKLRNCGYAVASSALDFASFGSATVFRKLWRGAPATWQGISLLRDTWGSLTRGNPRNRSCKLFAPSPEMGGRGC